jgi:hypothetical protein
MANFQLTIPLSHPRHCFALLLQLLQQRLGFLPVYSIKPFGEPFIDLCQQLPSFGLFVGIISQIEPLC